MTQSLNRFAALGAAGLLLTGCVTTGSGTQIVLLGQSFASGDEAVKEANLAIANARGAGCEAISVGGYGAGANSEVGGGLVIGVPVLLDCPPGTSLLPNGTLAP